MKIITLIFISLLSIACLPSNADEYDDAMFQLNRGEFREATELLIPLANDGFSPAQYQLAQIYFKGLGTAKDPQLGLQYLKKAADKNYIDAIFDLSVLYSEGKYVKQDLTKAFELTRIAAGKDLAAAQFNLAVMYYNGQGVRKDLLQASRWYQRAANLNYALAQFNLALMYFNGEGVEKSTEMSYIWNSIAAINGYPDAAKSRDMDANKLSAMQIKIANEKMQAIHEKIINQAKLREKMANHVKFY
jgi:hypothetical protein